MLKYMQARKIWSYMNDFNVKAVILSYQEGIQVKRVTIGSGIHPFLIWPC